MNRPQDLPKWLWLWIPIALTLLPYVVRIINPEAQSIMSGEMGVTENITVLILLCAIIVAIKIYKHLGKLEFPIFKTWISLLLLGCIYYMGEEISWGQHWIGWATPELWQGLNNQGETNLHNTSGLFDQLPRTVLSLAALTAIIVPIYVRKTGKFSDTSAFPYWWLPSYVNIPTCVAALGVSLHEKAYKLFDTTVPYILDISAGETKECMLAMFLLMYLASFYNRVKQLPSS